MLNRRQLLGTLSAGSLAALAPLPSLAAARSVIVVGGGMAGATVAKYLRLWSGSTIDVTLVTPDPTYVSNIMSNLVVTGQVAYSSLQFTYGNLTKKYGVKVVYGSVTGINGYAGLVSDATSGVAVTLSNSTLTTLYSDRLVLATGIQFDGVPLTGSPGLYAPVLHAWQAGAQTVELQKQLAAMPNGGTFVLTIPPKPYRCPPGPYERACVVADYLKRNKPGAKIYVLDANSGITAEPVNFGNAFDQYKAAGVLEYWPSTSVLSVSAGNGAGKNQTVSFNSGSTKTINGQTVTAITGTVVNVIPPHRAPDLLKTSGLLDGSETNFARVSVDTFVSMVANKERIHVIGDASETSLPKAGHVANQEAKICASAIISLFNGTPVEPMPTANSACFSPINNTQASWLTAVYQYNKDLPANKRFEIWDDVSLTKGVATEAAFPSTGNFSKMNGWYKVLMAETFS